ncbi:MAG: hypothetical protein ABR582_11465 [Gemmatimonadaceae bacterium]
MRLAQRLAAAAVVALTPASYLTAQNAGKNLAMDFRVTTSIQGIKDTMVMTGHAVGSGDKMRIDVTSTGTNSQISPLTSTGPVSMVITDTGKTITYIDAKKNQYLRVRPVEMVQQAQAMGGMKMDFSGTTTKVDSVGPGPSILGHPTSHYRVGTAMTMTMSAMGQQQSIQFSTTGDYFYATDLKGALNPFVSLSGSDMVTMFGASNKDFAEKMKAMQEKLPKGTPLRASTSTTIVSQGATRVTNSRAEVTAVQLVNADPKAFEIPPTYTLAPAPGMGDTGTGSTIPPR